MATRRTTHRSTAGKKLYAVRDTEGQFKDIQTYERAHAADLRQTSTEEAAAESATAPKAKRKAAKKSGKKAAKKGAQKAGKKKAARKKAKKA